jgi:hypothetical protein
MLAKALSMCCSVGLRPVAFETVEKLNCVHALFSRFIIFKGEAFDPKQARLSYINKSHVYIQKAVP